jgi:hypothetical protein
MVPGRKIIETAVRLSVADISILVSAVMQPPTDDVRLTTVEGSNNHALWSLMAEKGWLVDRGNPQPSLPLSMVSYSLVDEARHFIGAVAVTSYEGLRQGMSPEEIIAFLEGKPEPRLAHLRS